MVSRSIGTAHSLRLPGRDRRPSGAVRHSARTWRPSAVLRIDDLHRRAHRRRRPLRPEPQPGGTNAYLKPSRAASASRRLHRADPAHLAGETDLTDRGESGRHGQVEPGGGDRQRDGQVGGRLDDPDAADGRREHLLVVQRMRSVRRCSTASTMASRAESSPETVRRGEPGHGRPDQRLHLGDQRPAALHRHRDAGAGHRLGVAG